MKRLMYITIQRFLHLVAGPLLAVGQVSCRGRATVVLGATFPCRPCRNWAAGTRLRELELKKLPEPV